MRGLIAVHSKQVFHFNYVHFNEVPHAHGKVYFHMYQENESMLLSLQCLQGNGLIERERRLFVYFFMDPAQLKREVAELGRRVDALTAARQSST